MKIVSDLRDRLGVEPILRVLEVAPSTFYGWVAREAILRYTCRSRIKPLKPFWYN